MFSGVMSICREFTEKWSYLQKTYLPWIQDIPVVQGMSWVPTWKSLPNSPKCRTGRRIVSCFPALKFELASFARHTRVELETQGIIPSGLLWEKRIRYAMLSTKKIRNCLWKTLTDI